MKTLLIVPLSTPEALTLGALNALKSADRLYVQTLRHPSAAPLLQGGYSCVSMDDLYEQAEDFDRLNEAIAKRLTSGDSAVYAVMGDGCYEQLAAIKSACKDKDFTLKVLPGTPYYKAAFPEGQQGTVLTANGLKAPFNTELPLYITELDSRRLAGDVKLQLLEYYPDGHKAYLAVQEPQGSYSVKELPLYALDRQQGYFSSCVLYVPALAFADKQRYGYEDLIAVLRQLRAPGGCPWDREQTHESLKKDLREECYELMDAIDEKDDGHMIEELGDVLMQVLFHSTIAEEQGRFDERDVTDGIVRKLIYRHPHVFGTVQADTVGEVLKNWDALKKQEKGQTTFADTLKSVPKSFPAMLRCEKVQKRAKKVGFDFTDAADAFYKIGEETKELEEAMEKREGVEQEMGDLFFAAVNVCRLLGLDAEDTLHKAVEKFISRFAKMEELIRLSGGDIEAMNLSQMDVFWDKAKEAGN